MTRQKKPNVRRLRLKQDLRLLLEEFFVGRMGESKDMEITIADDLILLRCKEALSPSEANVDNLKAGRLLLQEVSEWLCRELQPNLNTRLYEITGLHLLDICVVLSLKQHERIYLIIMGGTV